MSDIESEPAEDLADAPEDADEEDDFPCCRVKQTGICEGDG